MPHRPLSPEQQRALHALVWLHDERARQQGRTYVLALAYLRDAFHRPRADWIAVEDHADHYVADRNLVHMIALIAAEYRSECEVVEQRFRFLSRTPELGAFLESVMAEGQISAPPEPQYRLGPVCTHSAQSWYTVGPERRCEDCGTEIRSNGIDGRWYQVIAVPATPKTPPPPPPNAWERLLKDEP